MDWDIEMRIRRSIVLLILALAIPTLASDNWPRYRGPGALGVAEDAELPDSWGTSKNVDWKRDIPGRGWSSPIVWGNRVFLTTVVNSGETEEARKGLYFGGDRNKASKEIHEWQVLCLDPTPGKVVWNEAVHKAAPLIPSILKTVMLRRPLSQTADWSTRTLETSAYSALTLMDVCDGKSRFALSAPGMTGGQPRHQCCTTGDFTS